MWTANILLDHHTHHTFVVVVIIIILIIISSTILTTTLRIVIYRIPHLHPLSLLLFTRRRLQQPCPNNMDHNLSSKICTFLYTFSLSAPNEKWHTRRVVYQVPLKEIGTCLHPQRLRGCAMGLMMPRVALRRVLCAIYYPHFRQGFTAVALW